MNYGITDAIEQAFVSLWADIIGIIPGLMAAVVVIVAGIIVSVVLGKVVERLVRFLQVDALAEKFKLSAPRTLPTQMSAQVLT